MLTSTQILSLRAAVIADTNLASARTNRDTQAIYDYYNFPQLEYSSGQPV